MRATRIDFFDTWRPGYGLATVFVRRANSTVLADIFYDEALTLPAENPLTLLEKTQGSVSAGKFPRPIYTAQAYELGINSVDSTGIVRPPLTGLAEEDGSKIIVRPKDTDRDHDLDELMARRIDVRDYGDFLEVGIPTASASANHGALINAIGKAASQGGGIVECPDGVYDIMPYSVPDTVIVEGKGRGATIFQCTQGSVVVTLDGPRAGLRRVTLDGLAKATNSVGVFSRARDQLDLDDIEIKRFEVGQRYRGGEAPTFGRVYISDCSKGAEIHGDNETVSGGDGTSSFGVRYKGGKVSFCTIAGLEFKYIDLPVLETVIEGMGFDTNPGTAVRFIGARKARMTDCWWVGNVVNLEVDDADPTNVLNTAADILIENGRMASGKIILRRSLENVVFDRMNFEDVTVDLISPKNFVTVRDCRETNVTLTGTAVAWVRSRSNARGASVGITTGAATTKAWALTMRPGQRALLTAKVLARGRNNQGSYWGEFKAKAIRYAADLNYEAQTGQFTPGNIVTGQTSGASGRITADTDNGTTGKLALQDVIGEFLDNEIIKDGSTGEATVNGAIAVYAAELQGTVQSVVAPDTNLGAGAAATFVANGPEIELRVTGVAGLVIEWTVDVDVVIA